MYKNVISTAVDHNLRFAVGGGLAAATYCGQWRDTKDLDLYASNDEREDLISLLTSLGFVDYFGQKAYDRKWIYRAWKDGTIIDVIWAMANGRATVDDHWLNGPEIEIASRRFHLLAPEEMVWNKLYILQHDRCDWPDILTILSAIGPDLDWRYLIRRVGEDAPLLAAVLSTFGWLCPGQIQSLPSWLLPELGLEMPRSRHPLSAGQRADLLDSRPWFGAVAGQGPEIQNSDIPEEATPC